MLIYSDPYEDGEITVDNGYTAYPHGPARQPSSVQRGSVQALRYVAKSVVCHIALTGADSKYPGDPLTPGKPSYKHAKRIARNATDISIPGQPYHALLTARR